jgi:hypothetical protein
MINESMDWNIGSTNYNLSIYTSGLNVRLPIVNINLLSRGLLASTDILLDLDKVEPTRTRSLSRIPMMRAHDNALRTRLLYKMSIPLEIEDLQRYLN